MKRYLRDGKPSGIRLEQKLGHYGVDLEYGRIGDLGHLSAAVHQRQSTVFQGRLDDGFRDDVLVIVTVQIDCELAHVSGY